MMSLDGKYIAISISDAPDRERLGFPQREIDRALATICTALVRAGADIVYGGNLDPDGYTFKIFRNLAGAYPGKRKDTPFHHVVAEPVGRGTRYETLLSAVKEGRGTVRTQLARGDLLFVARPGDGGVRLGGETVTDDAQLVAWFASVPAISIQEGHTRARALATQLVDARVILGGKMGLLADAADRYDGAMPGIAEEAIMTLEADKPLLVLGAFGGVSRDIAIGLDLLDPASRVPRGDQAPSYAASISHVERLRSKIPDAIRSDLSRIADDDRSEQTAFALTSLINRWLAIR
ncbi:MULTISPECIES: hypothetical protein [unclassified Sphingomonas]|uniref:hypothetical protein n=1 Tax=unclassified Sphingomonas TaxID=196159 RepID=UPI00286096FB|nr:MULTISPECIES: hypothetical protein [unclassified Sphingomonas]MDR6116010.1 hypothetical protein [Sphingomonas sp. SORGH_AS_0789]MDR6150317.1 hypothetical protein [Sphingomonas sp. SORGH_AS_0742]